MRRVGNVRTFGEYKNSIHFQSIPFTKHSQKVETVTGRVSSAFPYELERATVHSDFELVSGIPAFSYQLCVDEFTVHAREILAAKSLIINGPV